MELLPGSRVERYVVESRIGAGRSSTTYRVRHETLDSLHALTVPNVANAGLRARVVAGARIQARLRHPGVVSVTDVLTLEGEPALILDHVDGPTLDAFLAARTLDQAAIDAIATGLFEAIGFLHANSVAHRNLKPRTVFVDLGGKDVVPRITDFVLARSTATPLPPRKKPRVFGTPQYMAPEQTYDSDAADHRADLWSLGCLLYLVASGLPTFPDDDPEAVFEQVRTGDYTPLAHLLPEAPRRWGRALAAALTVDPEARVQTAEAMSDLWFEGVTTRPHLAASTAPIGRVTLVFTDIEGSTALWEAAPETARYSLRAHDAVLRTALKRHAGFEVKTEGDSFMVAFSDPAQAVQFCFDVQQELFGHPWSPDLLSTVQARAEPGFRGLRVRMGAHMGTPEARVTNTGADYFGPMVNRAARIAGAGHGGQILLSSEVARAVQAPLEERAAFTHLGHYVLRGLNGTQGIVQALPADLATRQFPPVKADKVEGKTTITPD